MNKETTLQRFRMYQRKIATQRYIGFLIGWDAATEAPRKSVQYRAQIQGDLAGEHFAYQMDPANIALLEEIAEGEFDAADQLSAKKYLKNINKIRYIPAEEYVQAARNRSIIARVWEEAKRCNDYASFAPHLERFLHDVKSSLSYRGVKDTEYFATLLDDNEEGMTIEKYNHFFTALKEELVPFTQDCLNNGRQIDDKALYLHVPRATQEAIVHYMVETLRFDLLSGVVKTSAHPFTTGSGSPTDVRFTVKYQDEYFPGAMMASLHEMGHALHSQQGNPAYAGTNLNGGPSAGIGESQSRFYENYIGRSQAFWQTHFPALQKFIPELYDLSPNDFWRMLNRSKAVLTRIEADELTYPLHIILRYEIERAIFAGEVKVKDLPELWNAKCADYLGIVPKTDTEGVLQDVHWGGNVGFGYFPTYALGTAYAAQFDRTLRQELDVDTLIRENKMEVVNSWLKDKIHFSCGLKTPEQILLEVTGEPFNVQYYLDYLKSKYRQIYFS